MRYREPECLHSIAVTMKTLLSTYDEASTEYRKYQKHILQLMCRELEKFLTPRVSKAAKDEALKRDIDSKIFQTLGWKHQKSILKDRDRSVFHLEHFVPVGQIAKQIIKLRHDTTDKIEDVLRTAEINWILKSEDVELTKRKFRSVRPDPLACYTAAGIELMDD